MRKRHGCFYCDCCSLPNRSYRPPNSMIRYMCDQLRRYLGVRILVGDDEVFVICNYLHGAVVHLDGQRV